MGVGPAVARDVSFDRGGVNLARVELESGDAICLDVDTAALASGGAWLEQLEVLGPTRPPPRDERWAGRAAAGRRGADHDPASGLAWVAGHLASTATLPDGLSLVSGSGTVSTDDDVVSLDRVDTALGESNDDQRRLSTGEVRVNHGLVNPCVGVSGELESGRPSPDTIDRVIGRPSSSGVSIGTRTISGIPCTTWWNGAWQSIAVAAELDFRILPSQAGRQVAKAGAFSGPRLIGRRHAIDDEAWDLASEDRLRNRLIVNFATRDSVDAHSQPTEGIHSG